MRPRKRDWKELEKAMPGVVFSGQEPWDAGALYSVASNADGTWSIVRGSLVRSRLVRSRLVREPKEQVTQRIEASLRGTALEVTRGLVALGVDLPLTEQLTGDLDLPTPKDLYFEACCRRLPGRFLKEAGDATRMGISLNVARRRGWKLHFFEEPDEDTLFSGGYLEALTKGEFPPVQTLGGWEGREVGSRRHGVVRGEDLDEVLGWVGVDPARVFGLGLEDRDASASTR